MNAGTLTLKQGWTPSKGEEEGKGRSKGMGMVGHKAGLGPV